jgi:hypothetical protein
MTIKAFYTMNTLLRSLLRKLAPVILEWLIEIDEKDVVIEMLRAYLDKATGADAQ